MKKIIGYVLIVLMFAGSICGITYGIKYAILSSQTDPEYTDELENKVSDYQSQMNTYYLTILDLQEQINDLKLQGTTDSATISSLENTITSLNSTVASLTASNTSNEETIAQNEETIADLNEQVAILQSESTDKSNEIITLKNTISSLQTQNESLQATNDSNLALITSLNAQIVTLNEQISTLTSQITQNTDTVTKLNTEISKLQKTISTYETYIASLETNDQAAVTFMYNGYVYSIQIVTKGTTASIADPPSSNYLKFNGWTLDGEIVDLSEQTIETNTVFTADVTIFYDVTFVSNDVTVDSQIVEANTTASRPTDPTLDGYAFDGWTVDGVNIVSVSSYMITGATTFTAKFTALHTVSFIYEDETISTQSVRDGAYATAPSVESTEEKPFGGWLLNGEIVDVSSYSINADIVFIAYILDFYDVTFVANDITIDTQSIKSGTYATLPTDPTLEGYSFDGWTIDGENVVDLTTYEITQNTTFISLFSCYCWEEMLWNGLVEFDANNVWTDGIDYYYSSNSNQYVLDIDSHTWSAMTWVGISVAFYGRLVWTDGIDYYFSSGSYQYVLEIDSHTWSAMTWTGLTSFSADYIWTDGIVYYYSTTSEQYVLNVDSHTWSKMIWYGLSSFYGSVVWTDGIDYYYSSNSNQYVLDIDSHTWSAMTWTGVTSFYGNSICKIGTDYYFLQGSNHYVLDIETHSWSETTCYGLTSYIPSNGLSFIFWTDGIDLYFSNSLYQYVLTKTYCN